MSSSLGSSVVSHKVPRPADRNLLRGQWWNVQKQLLEETEFGRSLKESVGELEAATKTLQEVGQALTREKLLDIVLESPNDARLRAYATHRARRHGLSILSIALRENR